MNPVFANTSVISKDESILKREFSHIVKIRREGKCPPWILQSKKIKHNSAKKTVFYVRCCFETLCDFPSIFIFQDLSPSRPYS